MTNTSWSGHRQPLPKATRARILKRDLHTCQACGGARCGNHPLEVDHRIPTAEGGSDADWNLQALGANPCHREKTMAEQARGRARKNPRRPPETHPGLINTPPR